MSEITAIILTHNESRHLRRCLTAVQKVAGRICVVDSFSNDATESIAREMGADFFRNPWVNHAIQFAWALDNCHLQSTWVMRIDADEYPDDQLIQSIRHFVQSPGVHNAAYFRRKIVFLRQPITHGFIYPALILRLWKNGEGTMEQRWMDEHIIVRNTRAVTLDGDLVDENLNDITWWTHKHTGYAIREVYEIVSAHHHTATPSALSGQARLKRWVKTRIYYRLPAGARAGAYFIYRYVLGLGFLDGKSGFYFHFLQAFWYRVFVDAKLHELSLQARQEGLTPREFLRRKGVFDH